MTFAGGASVPASRAIYKIVLAPTARGDALPTDKTGTRPFLKERTSAAELPALEGEFD
jgi:hypothetical protein